MDTTEKESKKGIFKMLRYQPLSGFFLCCVLVLAGCSGGPDDVIPTAPQNSVSVAPSVPSSTGEALPHSGAPKVENPLPASVLAGDPCTDALTPAQVEEALGSQASPRPDSLPVGKHCSWGVPSRGNIVAITYDTRTKEGLSALYERVKPRAVVWKELPPIQGFPAVAQVTPSGGDPKQFCHVTVGLADDLSFDAGGFIRESNVGKVDPCEPAARLADAAVTTLKQKAGM